MKDKAKKLLNRVPGLYRTVSAAYRSLGVVQGVAYVVERAPKIMMGQRPIVVGYASEPRPRWGYGQPAHAGLAAVIEAQRPQYERRLNEFGALRAAIEAIPVSSSPDSGEPSWENSFFSGIDAVALYGMIATHRPKRYFEIGSGNSTKLARRAIRDQGLSTTILSIDPHPQASIDALCDTVMRQRLEEVDLALFDQLEAGDILFFDGSHYAFTNSDVVVLWLELLPRIKPGVLIHIHDIFLPYDYPEEWVERYYTEQYLLAVALLAPRRAFDVAFPNQFVMQDGALRGLAEEKIGPRISGSAASFWLTARGS
jgi:hypothetical protein